MLVSFFASVIGPLGPRRLFRHDVARLSPTLAIAGLALATAASALLLVPFMRAAVNASPLFIEEDMATKAILFHTVVLNPVAACVAALVTAVLLWVFPMAAGHEPRLGGCVIVAAVMGGVEAARRMFMAGVLWVRELAGRPDPAYDVRTGLDALLLAVSDVPQPVMVLAGHVGLFEVWAVVMATIALATAERLPRRVAAWTCVTTFALINTFFVLLEALR
jgi:hypothetical protein